MADFMDFILKSTDDRIEQLNEQRLRELEFRVQTLEKAVLASAERIAVLERMWERFYKGEIKQ